MENFHENIIIEKRRKEPVNYDLTLLPKTNKSTADNFEIIKENCGNSLEKYNY